MEQYVHLLIPSEPQFFPELGLIAQYFNLLTDRWHYKINGSDPYVPGIRLIWPLGEPEAAVDEKTGRRFTQMPRFGNAAVKEIADLPSALRSISSCELAVTGGWPEGRAPFKDEEFSKFSPEGDIDCGLSCGIRPVPVCTSEWWGDDGESPGQICFGKPGNGNQADGFYTHPVSRQTVRVPGCGSARFWLGFNFGDWLISRVPSDFILLDPGLVATVEDCFGVRFIQAGRGIA